VRTRAARILGLLRGRLARAVEARPPALGRATTITLRLSDRADEPALERFGELSERQVAPGRYLVADVDGDPWAALPLCGGDALADPFLPAREVKELLALRAAQLQADAGPVAGGETRLARLDDCLMVPRSLIEPR
jgi:hypothetical protein